MRRSICYCEPNQALAGEIYTWQFIYTTASPLPKGTLLRFDLMSDGRDIDWELPSVNIKDGANVIYAMLENGKTLNAKEVEVPDAWAPLYEFELPAKVNSGESFTIVIGSSKISEKLNINNGTRAQTYSQRRRPFLLYIDTTGKRHFEEPEVFSIDIKGNILTQIKVLTPSFVQRNKRFDVVVRFEDDYGNLTSNAPEETLIELTHEHLRENLNWKLFVPETGFITIPNLYFNDEGIYTIQLKNSYTGQVYRSSPIKCFSENGKSLYWGLLHGESIRVDSTENIDSCLRHFRDEKSMHFYSVSPFEEVEETPNETWKLISQNVTEFDEQERFTTFLGFQWQGAAKSEGVRHFIWSKDNKPVLRKKDAKYSTLKKIYKSFTPKDFISIPTFTMGKGFEYDFKNFDPEFERVVEIYNSWGSSECTKKQGNLKPIKGPVKKGVQESAEGSIVDALKSNKRFGFVAGGLDDRGIYADFFDGDQEQYSPGMTAIISKEHSRSSLYESLYHRSCYATTGERIILGIYIAGLPMGSEINTSDKPGLVLNRHIAGYVAGTDKIKSIEVIRNGDVLQTFNPDDYHYEFEYDDMANLKEVCIDSKDKESPFVFYYLRVVQEDGHMAWSSPIWVDFTDDIGAKKKAK
ncbi:uncharacterized protein CPn_0512/CP_0242/CPj0512/CpB0533 [Waddlia chondrophila 2032/99]|uniref:DUF3604 domain-containing protein n=2 Tax=Waddlia chondrophila TaxID=71667 RepID=D6YW83_WADCW|nr:hypothetical protein [Waddlia chondrophila]ADI38394.1 conserved hypothetical protein [Waddlia chondrophila WSU 86-1044]CCB91478.1 uncharacterized protein CPn_0512/CP_0242/CPj0512/CpB0533 [Waddlia chondrophila 2032/99]